MWDGDWMEYQVLKCVISNSTLTLINYDPISLNHLPKYIVLILICRLDHIQRKINR